jgi:hypothetical protein
MNRPLTVQERLTVETIPAHGHASRALVDLVSRTMFQLGHVVGVYPSARAHVVLDNSDAENFVLRMTATIPREEIVS